MKNKVIAILEITPEAYDEQIFQAFWTWCRKYATSENNCQSLLGNAVINRWFMRQFSEYEKNFVQIVENSPKRPADVDYLYLSETDEIYKRFPNPIIDNYKTINPEFQTIINTQFTVYGN